MTDLGVCPSPDDLLAFENNELPFERKTETQRHVEQCQRCQEHVRTLRHIRMQLAESHPAVESSRGWDAVRERLTAQITRRPASSERRALRRATRISASLAIALVAILVAGTLAQGNTVEGGASFMRWVSAGRLCPQVSPKPDPSHLPLVAPTDEPVEPDESGLPFDLGLVGDERREPGLVQRFYRAPNGLSLMYSSERRSGPAIELAREDDRFRLLTVASTEVFVSLHPREDIVIMLSWSDADVLTSLLVLDQPVGGLSVEDAAILADAFLRQGATLD